ncbi:MAG: hypothetical protein A2Z28_02770 [Chloroflexi bacterium RBG_16_51_9]|nr:MAG: hypothetical protein A2Z28_02770 [Chloroflexi bacterium RBG_16_51_9]
MEVEDALYFPNRPAWQKWLEKHHDKEKDVWLLRYKKDSGKPSVSYEDALEEALCFGWIDGKIKGIDNEKSGLRFSPRKARSRWSKVNRDKAEKLIAEGRMTAAGLAKIEEAKKSGAWDNAYVLREKQEIPADLEEALSKNKVAWDNFHSFPPSRRNPYIYWLNEAKTPATRQRRIAEVVTRSAMPKRPRPKQGEKWW